MQKMYEDFKDIAEFRLVYIKEAHASDSDWPVGYAKELGITQHKTYGERCAVASKLLSDKNLTIPTLIDDMENTANTAYKGWPDRVYLVRKDGKLGVAAKRGPWGFKPAIEETRAWLAGYKDTGKEPPITRKPSASDTHAGNADAEAPCPLVDPAKAAAVVGQWDMKTEFQGNAITATMSLDLKEGRLVGVWASQGMEIKMSGVSLDGDELRFKRSMGHEGPAMSFTGTITGGKIAGKYTTPFGELKSTGKRRKTSDATDDS